MAAFEYHALVQGRSRRGVILAESSRHARRQLRERGLVPLQVELVQSSTRTGWSLGLSRERSLVLRQFSALLAAGLPMEEALALIAEQSESARIRRSLAAMRARVLEGQSLSEAMAEQPALFPAMYSRTVAAGERAGQLDRVMARLAEHAEQRQAAGRGLIVALVYPALLALISLAVVWGLIGFVVPRVIGVFEHAGRELPLLTRSLLGVAELAGRFGGWLLLLTALIVALVLAALKRDRPRRRLDRALLGAPLIGQLVRTQIAASFARALAILVGSGVPVVEALQTAAGVCGNRAAADDIRQAAARVREGSSLNEALADARWLPALTRRLIAGGEKAGALAPMLDHAAAMQEADLRDASQVLLAVLQPVLILVVGLMVLYIVLAILLPIMNLSQLLG